MRPTSTAHQAKLDFTGWNTPSFELLNSASQQTSASPSAPAYQTAEPARLAKRNDVWNQAC